MSEMVLVDHPICGVAFSGVRFTKVDKLIYLLYDWYII